MEGLDLSRPSILLVDLREFELLNTSLLLYQTLDIGNLVGVEDVLFREPASLGCGDSVFHIGHVADHVRIGVDCELAAVAFFGLAQVIVF